MFVNVNCSSKFVLVESQFRRHVLTFYFPVLTPRWAVFQCSPISREFVRTCACVKRGRTYVCSYVRTEPRMFVKFCSHRRHLFIKYKFLWNICRRADPCRDTVIIFKKGEVVQRKDNKRLLRAGFQYRNVAHISDRMLYWLLQRVPYICSNHGIAENNFVTESCHEFRIPTEF
jgi:hypothetical protein